MTPHRAISQRLAHRVAPLVTVFGLMVTACAAGDGVVSDAALGVRETTTTAATTTTIAAPPATAAPEPLGTGVVRVGSQGAPFAESPGGDPVATIASGVVMGYTSRQGGYLEVMNTCNIVGWVSEADVAVTEAYGRESPGPGFDLSRAVVVLDPGHGGRDWGGVGQSGLSEKAVNLDISERVRDLMETSNDVDWESGSISTGDAVPAFGTVWLTRDRSAPDDGDIELGLGFRSALANAAGADAFVSIHNNTVPRVDTDIPGTEVFYSLAAPGSDRLASLLYDEVLRSLELFDATWRGSDLLGAKARIDPETDADYYGILRRASMPAAIVEGVYISEPDEEELLATDEFRQAYAEGVYRGILRFLTTDDVGSAVREPEIFRDDAGTVNASSCVLAEQPE